MKIAGTLIDAQHEPWVIAELSNNHLRDRSRLLDLITQAAAAGVSAVKIQTYDADSITIDCKTENFRIQAGPWAGRYYHDLYREIAMPLEWTADCFAHARRLGITLFSSPFDDAAVARLEECGCPAYKIASFEINDHELLRTVGRTGKPVIVSTGVANWGQIVESLGVLRSAGAGEVALLHCTSSYPARPEQMNLTALARLRTLVPVTGLSDHCLENTAAVASIALGGCIIEKHFTLRRADGGPDAFFSLEPPEMAALVREVRVAWQALGSAAVFDAPSRPGAEHSRTVHVVRDVAAGERLTAENVRVIRPGTGIPAAEFSQVLGRAAKRALPRGTPLRWDLLS